MGRKVQSRRFILRPYRRISAWYKCYYLSGSLVGKGVVMNLSRTGLRVLGDHSLVPGTELSVRVIVEEDGPPIEISRATVQWADQYEFGLRIDHLIPESAHRLAVLISREVSTRGSLIQ